MGEKIDKKNLADDAAMRIMMRQIAKGIKEKFDYFAKEWKVSEYDLYITFRIKDGVQEITGIKDWNVKINATKSEKQDTFLDDQKDHELIDVFDVLLPELKEILDGFVKEWKVKRNEVFIMMWYDQATKAVPGSANSILIRLRTIKSLPEERQKSYTF